MESQLKQLARNSKGSVLLGALVRLSLLVGPEAAVVKFMGHSPVVCIVAAVAVLGFWLSVDIGPFRASPAVAVKAAARPVAEQPAPSYAQNLTKAQWWSYLFCRVVVFFMLFHSKLMI